MKLSGNAVMDSQKSRQNFDLVEESHHDNSNTLVSINTVVYKCWQIVRL